MSKNKKIFIEKLKKFRVVDLKSILRDMKYRGYSKLRKKELINKVIELLSVNELNELKIPEKTKRNKKINKGTGEIIKLSDKKREMDKDYPLCVKSSSYMLLKRQKETIMKFLDSDLKGFLISHGTGCGKTLTAVAYSQCYLNKNPNNKVIVLTPASLQNNFRDGMEFYGIDWKDPRYFIYSYTKFVNLMKKKDVTKLCSNKLLIIDEVQNLKNPKTKIAIESTACSYSKSSKVLLLTATPLVNAPSDFISYILNLIMFLFNLRIIS